MLVEIGPQIGNYSASPAARWVTVVVHNVLSPVSAKSLFPAGRLSNPHPTLTSSSPHPHLILIILT